MSHTAHEPGSDRPEIPEEVLKGQRPKEYGWKRGGPEDPALIAERIKRENRAWLPSKDYIVGLLMGASCGVTGVLLGQWWGS